MKQSAFYKFWALIIVSIIAIALYFWWAHIQFWQNTLPWWFSHTTIQNQLSGIQNITWSLYISSQAVEPLLEDINTSTILSFQTYDFTEKRIKDAFKKLLFRGVSIRMIMEDKKFQQYKNTFKEIQNLFSWYATFWIKSDKQMKTMYTHSKIMLTDASFWVQTANLTHASLFSNREYFFRSTHSWYYTSLQTVFEKDWNWTTISAEDIHPNLVICPLNCRWIITSILASAQQSIIIETQYITDELIFSLLEEKKWIEELKILVSDTQSNDELMKRFWTSLVKKLKNPYLHAKMILIDHKILLLWSMNLSSTSLDENREIGILLIDPLLINQFTAQFEKDWK